jgi:hypothetical protein
VDGDSVLEPPQQDPGIVSGVPIYEFHVPSVRLGLAQLGSYRIAASIDVKSDATRNNGGGDTDALPPRRDSQKYTDPKSAAASDRQNTPDPESHAIGRNGWCKRERANSIFHSIDRGSSAGPTAKKYWMSVGEPGSPGTSMTSGSGRPPLTSIRNFR